MLEQLWNLDLYSWDESFEPPFKLYCIPIDPIDPIFPEA